MISVGDGSESDGKSLRTESLKIWRKCQEHS